MSVFITVQRRRTNLVSSTITPIRVSHEMILQVFYSVEGETVAGAIKDGPGELRMMAVKMPVLVPSVSKIPSMTISTIRSTPPIEPAGRSRHPLSVP